VYAETPASLDGMFAVGFIFDLAGKEEQDPADQKNSSQNSRQGGDAMPVRWFQSARRSFARIEKEAELKKEQEDPQSS
jgi:hypothetical protein